MHAAARDRARSDKEHIGAHGSDLLLDLLLGALANAHHGYHCAHTDDDAQHREAGTQLVAGQSSHCDSHNGK